MVLLQSHHRSRVGTVYYQKKEGVHTSKNAIKKLSIKLAEFSGQYLSADEALENLKATWKEYWAAKKVASELNETFQEEPMTRDAIDHKIPPETNRR